MKIRLTTLFTAVLATSALAAPDATSASGKSPATPALQEIVLVYKTHFDIGYPPPPSSVPVAKNTLENETFQVTVDPARGTITSLMHKRSGRELVDATATHGFGQLLHERFSADEVAGFCKA